MDKIESRICKKRIERGFYGLSGYKQMTFECVYPRSILIHFDLIKRHNLFPFIS